MRIESAICLGGLLLAGSLAPHRVAFAQQPARPEFEVASVKLNTSGRGVPSRTLRPGSINYRNVTVFEYTYLAFDVQPWQVIHGSAVSLADRYDIEARASEAVPVSQVQSMLRSLLEDRFQLRSHRETKELPVYILTVAKDGPHSLKLFDPDVAKSETDPKGDTLQQLDKGLSASLKDVGLKLEPQKTPIEMLVVDSVSKPDAN
jgi:hypothetical protein